MSNANQDSGFFGAVVAVGLLLIVGGGGFFLFQRTRHLQAAAELAQLQALEAKERAEIVAQQQQQAAQANRSVASASSPAPADINADSLVHEDAASVQAEIVSKLMAQQADWNQGDLDAFMKVYWNSEKLTFASGGKVTQGYQATLDGYKARYSTKEKLGKLTFDNLEFQRLADEVMLVLGTWHLERGDDSVGGNFSLIWQKIDGQWLIVHDHTSALTPKKE